jgi:hypothetical protein
MSGIVCSGNIRVGYVDDNGALTGGYIGIVNATKLMLTVPAPTLVQRISKQNSTFGQALDQVAFPKPMDIALDTDDVGDSEILGWAVGGTSAGYTQTSGAVTDEAVTAVLSQWVSLASRSVSAVVVKNVAGTTTYVANTDYIVDLSAGMIQCLPTPGAITAAEALHVSYTKAALTGNAISVGTRAEIQVRIEGDMINLANNKPVHVVVPKAKLSPAGGLDLLGSTFLVASMTGNALVVSGQPPATITEITS